MKRIKRSLFYKLLLLFIAFNAMKATASDHSVYTQKPNDAEAVFFTSENYDVVADGKTDVTEALQAAINKVKADKNFGILFIPEGKYRISKTIYVPKAIRIIGYGKNRPEIILGKDTEGYQEEQNYMIWFTNNMVEEGEAPEDAGAGTFYSALSNINLRIEKGNPEAIAIRSHFAQHSFVSHCIIHIGEGKAGIFDVGNEMQNVKFYGGEYGITTSRTSPGWPMMMVDTYFEGQRKAAIITREAGLTIVNMRAKDVPVAIEMQEGVVDRLFIENSFFENVSKAAVIVSVEENDFSQLNLLNIACKNVPLLVKFRQSGRRILGEGKQYKVTDFTYGLVLPDIESHSKFETISKIESLSTFPTQMEPVIKPLPPMDSWVNIKELGAKGDGETDDTQVFLDAVAKYKIIYVPQGWYRITETIKMKPGTKLIGLHPFATQFILKESEPAFSGFGTPKPMIQSSEGGDDILNGIGISTGGYNYRAVGCKWMAGAHSLMNDVKFVGGHGTMKKPGNDNNSQRSYNRRSKISSPSSPVHATGKDLAWDNQYWSLWVTNNGGGTFKDIWTASTYATSGLYVSNTTTPGRIFAMSLEHHVRNETRFENVSSWKMYAFQFEEEGLEGKDNVMFEISNSNDLMIANLFMYRVIRAHTPKEFGVRLWDSEDIHFRNVHNYTQILQVIEIPVYDVNKGIPVYEWDFARLDVSGEEKDYKKVRYEPGEVEQLATGFEFATGATSDSKGNIYFCEHRLKKIYKWSVETNSLSLLTDYPWKPFTLSTDSKDNLIVIFRYDPQPGYFIDGEQETVPRLPDDNPMYSSWGNSGWAARAYSIDPDNPDETMVPLERVPTNQVENVRKVIHPASRWRGDFDQVVNSMPEYSFVAPDGVTIIPETYDLGRSAALVSVVPEQTESVFIAKENNKTTVKLEVNAQGRLINAEEVHPQGQYSNVVDKNGNLYIADGQIYVYNKDGNEINRIKVKERPISIAIGGKDKDMLFITTSTSLYSMKIEE